MSTNEELLRARAKELDQEKLRTVLETLKALYPEGVKHAPDLILVLRYIADVMEHVVAETTQR